MLTKSNFDKFKKIALFVILNFCIINSGCANVTEISGKSYKFGVTRSFDADIIFEVKAIGEAHLLSFDVITSTERTSYSMKLKVHEYNQIVNLFSKIQNLPNEDTMHVQDGSIWEAVISTQGEQLKSFNSPLTKTDDRGLREFVELAKILWNSGMSKANLGKLY